MGKNVHVVPHPEGWAVKKEGAGRASAVVSTQAEAIHRGKATAKKEHSELNIHGENGRIREKSSYGNDPFPPRDKK